MDPIQGHGQTHVAIVGQIHGMPFFGEPLLNEAGDFLLILHDQEPHGRIPPGDGGS